MTYDELKDFFDGPTKAAEALGIKDRRAVASWGDPDRRIPSKWQIKAEALSGGKLKADEEARQEAAAFGKDYVTVAKVA